MATAKVSKTPKIGWSDAHSLVREYIKNKFNVLLTGSPGIGKTAMVKVVAKQLGYSLVIFHPVVSDPTDFKGMPWVFTDNKGKQRCVFIPFDQLEALTKATKPTICFLDDFGQAPGSVQAACMQLLHGSKLNGIQISKHVRFVACTNRKQDRAGVSGILEPVKSRFHGIFELVPELDPWADDQISKGMTPLLVAFMRHRPNWLTGGDDGWKPESDIVNQPCPRTIEYLSDVINMQLDKVIRPTAYAGAVGEAMANEYFAFESLLVRMPDLDVVCNNPMGAEAPGASDIMYAMIGALHARMDRSNIDNIYKYIDKHFPKELQAVFHFDVKKFNDKLIHTKAYIDWAANNGDLLTN